MMRLFNIFILFITLISSSSVSSTKVESCDDSTTCQTTNANSDCPPSMFCKENSAGSSTDGICCFGGY